MIRLDDFLNSMNESVDDKEYNLILKIESNQKKIKFDKAYSIYDVSVLTAISNSKITYFYSEY